MFKQEPLPRAPGLKQCVKYANEITDDGIHSNQYHIHFVNRATLAIRNTNH